MTSCTGSVRGGFWGFWKKSVELRTRHRTGRVDFRGSLRPDEFARYGRRTRWGADGKVIIERLCISLPYVETFNSKVIKGFVPELRSRKCLSCFGIPMFYVYMLWTFYVCFPYSCWVCYRLIVSSLSPHSLQSLFCWVLSILALIWLVLTTLFCAAIRRDSDFDYYYYYYYH